MEGCSAPAAAGEAGKQRAPPYLLMHMLCQEAAGTCCCISLHVS